MNRRKLTLCLIALTLIGGTALLLAAVPQKLGTPGVKATPILGSQRWQIHLPEQVLDCNSRIQEPDTNALAMLPNDTSMAERLYYKSGILPVVASVILMGTDRTSIHKAEYCLRGQGMHIDNTTEQTLHLEQPEPYDLPIIKIVATYPVTIDDKVVVKKCVYVYWYVADGALSNDRSGFERMWSMARRLVFSGVLERWAYVRFYTVCDPGQEEAAFDEIKQIITDAVPQFQLAPRSSHAAVAAQR